MMMIFISTLIILMMIMIMQMSQLKLVHLLVLADGRLSLDSGQNVWQKIQKGEWWERD